MHNLETLLEELTKNPKSGEQIAQTSSLTPHKPFQWWQQHYLHEWGVLPQGLISCTVLQEAAGRQEEAGHVRTQQCSQSSLSRALLVLLSSISLKSISGISQLLHTDLTSTPANAHWNNRLLADSNYFFYFNWKSLSYSGPVHRGFLQTDGKKVYPSCRLPCCIQEPQRHKCYDPVLKLIKFCQELSSCDMLSAQRKTDGFTSAISFCSKKV